MQIGAIPLVLAARFRSARLSCSVLATAGALATLVGCAEPSAAQLGAFGAATPLDQYPLSAARAPQEVAIRPHPAGLSPAQRGALAQFAARWRSAGGDTVVLRAPLDAPDSGLAAHAQRDAAQALHDFGVPASAIRLVGYRVAGRPGAPVVASFDAYNAVIPYCADKWGELSATRENRVHNNFACSIHANMAAQIADPADIVRPAAMGPSDAGRRMVVLGKYRDGKLTSTEKDTQASASTSGVN